MNSLSTQLRIAAQNARKTARKARFSYALKRHAPSARVLYLMGLGKWFPNLGDQAQAAAIPLWLNKHFGRQVIQLRTHELEQDRWNLPARTSPHEIVFMHSGGNFGDDWYETQLLREQLVSDLHDRAIIQLPQTIHYSSGEEGLRRLERSQAVFGTCKHLMLFGRDRQSAELAKRYFPTTKVDAKPDMVLSLQSYIEKRHPDIIRAPSTSANRVLLIMRNDKEGIFSNGEKSGLMAALKSQGYAVELWDTDVKDRFPDDDKLTVILRYLRYIASFDMVVTDRYHGLIFTVLCKRPCVVLPTHNHKLTSAFDWFSDVNFVARANGFAAVADAIETLRQIGEYRSPDWDAQFFDPMACDIKTFLQSAGYLQPTDN